MEPAYVEPEHLCACQELLGHRFQDPALLVRALTHASLKGDGCLANERLEFLGDAVLGFVITEELFRSFPEASEGSLTHIKSIVVSTRTLSARAREMGLDAYLLMGKGMAHLEKLPPSLLANLFEAITAALYLDAGMDAARAFVVDNLSEAIDRVVNEQHVPNYKSQLQQYTQRELCLTPTYRVVQSDGPDHSRIFQVMALVGDQPGGIGDGRSKKEAEQRAAAATLAMLLGAEAVSLAADRPTDPIAADND